MDKNNCNKVGCGSYSCPSCRSKLDDHKQMINLLDDFHSNRVQGAEQNLVDRFYSIKNNLNQIYSDDISWLISSCYDLNDCEHALNQIDAVINGAVSLENEIDNVEKEKNEAIKKLNDEHQEKINELNKLIDLEKSKLPNFDKEDNDIKLKKNKVEELKESKKEIENEFKKIDISDYVKEERNKAENDFQKQKIVLDENYYVPELKLEKYNNDELDLRQKYLEGINRIKSYSQKIPNYYNWIRCMGLNYYLN